MPKLSRAEQKLAMREEARRKIHGSGGGTASQRRNHSENVDRGLGQLKTKMAEGGDGKAKSVKSELTYLINNYSPRFDNRIDQLIDIWRRTGDPEYDPSIRSKARQARAKHSRNSRAL